MYIYAYLYIYIYIYLCIAFQLVVHCILFTFSLFDCGEDVCDEGDSHTDEKVFIQPKKISYLQEGHQQQQKTGRSVTSAFSCVRPARWQDMWVAPTGIQPAGGGEGRGRTGGARD